MAKKETKKKAAPKATKVGNAKPSGYVWKKNRKPADIFQYGVDKSPAWFKLIEENDSEYFETLDGTKRKVAERDFVYRVDGKGVMSMKRGRFKKLCKEA